MPGSSHGINCYALILMMKFILLKRLFQYYLPATLTLFMLVTIERNVDTDIGGYEKLYGLPFPFISGNYAFTHHFDVYILMMLTDLIFYFIVTLLFFKLFEKFGLKFKTHWTFISIGVIVIIFWTCSFYMITFESTFKLANDFHFKTNSNRLHFGSYPW
jgi:hypothetical protein